MTDQATHSSQQRLSKSDLNEARFERNMLLSQEIRGALDANPTLNLFQVIDAALAFDCPTIGREWRRTEISDSQMLRALKEFNSKD